jgi:glucan endo-1,3-alpha-glucosidase
MKLFVSLSVILVSLFTPWRVRADVASPLVVAHWIVPMSYVQGEPMNATMQNDIRAATELGIDGFALDVFSGAQANQLMRAFISAADSIGASQFKFFLSADMARKFAPADIVAFMKSFAANPHYLMVNQKALLSTFGGGNLGNAWWLEGVLNPLKQAGVPVTFIPYFDRPNPNGDTPNVKVWTSTIENFPSVDGLFNFLIAGSTPFYINDPNIGRHWWSILAADEALAQALQASGKLYMASAAPYYWAACHPVRQYMEYQGGRGMDNLWTSIITKQHPNIVQLVTWNDYSESTYIQPTRIPNTNTVGLASMPHLGYYELLKYYIAWFHSGAKPTISKDGMFFFYRIHPNDVVASNDRSVCQLGPVAPSQKWGNITDVIYVTTALTAPGQLIVRFGSSAQTFNIAAGLNTVDVPFTGGKPTFELWRNGQKLASMTGTEIVEKPVVYNFNVNSGYAIANGGSSDTWTPRSTAGVISDWFSISGAVPEAPASVITK